MLLMHSSSLVYSVKLFMVKKRIYKGMELPSGTHYSEAQKAFVSVDGVPLCICCIHDNIPESSCDAGVKFAIYDVNRSLVHMCALFVTGDHPCIIAYRLEGNHLNHMEELRNF